MFGIILISICTIMHLYVFARTYSLPILGRFPGRKAFVVINLIFWLALVSARYFVHRQTGTFAMILESVGMIWLGVVFLIFLSVFVVDLLTLYGLLFKKYTIRLRIGLIIFGIVLSIIAIIQGFRPPVFSNYEIQVPNLPQEMNGKVIVAVSDLHVGTLIGVEWLEEIIFRIQQKKPDLVFLLGDILEGHSIQNANKLITTLSKLNATYGVWAVFGNHFFYGPDTTTALSIFEKAGIQVLRNKWVEVIPGLILSGVDDLTSSQRKKQNIQDLLDKALNNRPINAATIFLSHSPLQIDKLSKSGINLMLSGHTHGGQIWPFNYIVKQRYPFIDGKYKIGAMDLIVSRGTGTWGPRMRLFKPSEILHIKLNSIQYQRPAEVQSPQVNQI